MGTEDIRKFQETCRSFWVTATKYEDDLLKNLTWIHPCIQDYSKVSEVQLVASRLPQVIKEEQRGQVCEEFMDYCTSELPLDITRAQNISIDTYWHKIGLVKDDNGQLKYSLLSKLAKSVLIVPHGNADVERLFSHMGLKQS